MARNDDDCDEIDYSGFDTSNSDVDSTTPCPHCGKLIDDDAVRCPQCGQYLSKEDAPNSPKPAWILVGVAVCILIILVWILSGF
jgi:predicted nucleic acid-binding Zn ribbon protein